MILFYFLLSYCAALLIESHSNYFNLAESMTDLVYEEDWLHLHGPLLQSPLLGAALLLTLFLSALFLVARERNQQPIKQANFVSRLEEYSSTERLLYSYRHKKDEDEEDIIPIELERSKPMQTSSVAKSKLGQLTLKQRVKNKFMTVTKRSLVYETLEERRVEADRIKQDELLKNRQRKLEEDRARQERDKKKVAFESTQINQQPSDKSMRVGERKTTLQKNVEKGEEQQNSSSSPKPQTQPLLNPPTQSIFNPPSQPVFKPADTIPSIPVETKKESFSSIFTNNANPPAPNPQASKPFTMDNAMQGPSLFSKPSTTSPIQTIPAAEPPKQIVQRPKPNVPQVQKPQQNAATIPMSLAPPQAPQAPSAPAIGLRTLSSEEYFQGLIKFAEPQAVSVEIPTIMANLGGAKSSLNDLLTFAQSFLDTINKADDNQLTTFSVKIYEGILRQISTSNLKDGIYRIPPKSKTDQVEKNSINCYILYINLYRLMGYEKVWVIVFGKLLKLLEFTYKRKEDLKKYTDLELLANKHLDKRGEIEGKYLSRIDYLTYLLFGLTAYDPIMIFKQIEEKEPSVRQSREKIESWGREWNYREFWMLIDLILKNKHDSYFKPILYMNILSSLYPRIYLNKLASDKFKAENELYKTVLEEGKKYFSRFKTIKELKNLQESEEGSNFEYDGDNFVQGIKVLESRLTVEKVKEFNLKGDNYSNAREYESKSNVFYYFCKEK